MSMPSIFIFLIIEYLMPVLEPLVEATEFLTKEKEPTAGAVYLLLSELVTQDMAVATCTTSPQPGEATQSESDGPEEAEEESRVAKTLKNMIRERLISRFDFDECGRPNSMKSPLLLASFLDPRYKSLAFLEEKKADMLIHCVKELMEEDIHLQQAKEETDEESVPMKVKAEPVEEGGRSRKRLCERLVGDVVDLTAPSASVTREIRDYRAEPVRVANPLVWWREKQYQFPTVARLAAKYLAIPPTEVPSERLFSAAGQTVTNLRASLDGDTVDQLLFINKNKKIPAKMSHPCAFLVTQDAPDIPLVPIPISSDSDSPQPSTSATHASTTPDSHVPAPPLPTLM
jgi:hypothetical protein